MRRSVIALLAAVTALAATAADAAGRREVAPQDRAEERIIRFSGKLPACDDPAVLGEITSWFNSREAKFWGPLEIVGYEKIRPIAHRPWGDDFIPRQFCTGEVMINDGKLRRVDYSIRERLGLLTWTWNVNWCVSGLDRHRSYAPDCKMARP